MILFKLTVVEGAYQMFNGEGKCSLSFVLGNIHLSPSNIWYVVLTAVNIFIMSSDDSEFLIDLRNILNFQAVLTDIKLTLNVKCNKRGLLLFKCLCLDSI
jgi:hypothetical protein